MNRHAIADNDFRYFMILGTNEADKEKIWHRHK